MNYFNHPKSIGQLKAEYNEIEKELALDLSKSGDMDNYLKELKAMNEEYGMWLKKLRQETMEEKHTATKYFKNPKSLEELDNQYRLFIRKYSVQQNGDKILAEIEKEYKLLQKEIKYNSGKLSTMQQIHRGLHELNETREYKNQQQEKKIQAYKNHKYTKAELQNLINQQKQMINKAISVYLKKGVVLRTDVSNLSNGDMLNIINDKVIPFAGMEKEFTKVVEETAYALESIAVQNGAGIAKLNYQMEQLIGDYAKKVYITLEEKYADPIKTYNRDKEIKEDKKYEGVGRVAGKIGIFICFFGVPAFFLLIAFSDFSFNHNVDDLISGIEVAVVYIVFEIAISSIFWITAKKRRKKRAKAKTQEQLQSKSLLDYICNITEKTIDTFLGLFK